MRKGWRTAYDLTSRPSIERTWRRSLATASTGLRHYYRKEGDAAGEPFAVALPDGHPISWQLGLGFIGQQPFVGYLLLERELRKKDADVTRQGEAISISGPSPASCPAACPGSTHHWPSDNGTRTDLSAQHRRWDERSLGSVRSHARHHDAERPAWRACMVRAGDWLLRVQNPDGSWFRRYGQNGGVLDDCPYTTPNVVPFLAGLYRLTGDERYLKAVLHAGSYMWERNPRALPLRRLRHRQPGGHRSRIGHDRHESRP